MATPTVCFEIKTSLEARKHRNPATMHPEWIGSCYYMSFSYTTSLHFYIHTPTSNSVLERKVGQVAQHSCFLSAPSIGVHCSLVLNYALRLFWKKFHIYGVSGAPNSNPISLILRTDTWLDSNTHRLKGLLLLSRCRFPANDIEIIVECRKIVK